MTRTEILMKMHAEVSRRLFRTMQLGGSAATLRKMEDEGLIRSQSRYGGRMRQRDWYLSEEQHAALGFLFAETGDSTSPDEKRKP